MIALIRCEICRLKSTVVGATLASTALLAALGNYGVFFANDLGVNVAVVCACGVFAVIVGMMQMRAYTEDKQWVFLINRPLGLQSVLLSLCVAATICFLVSIVVPWTIAIWLFSLDSAEIVEFRHFLIPLYLFGLAVCSYFAGVTIGLSRSFVSVVLLWIPLLPVISLHVGGNVAGLLAVLLLLSLALLIVYSRPALGSPPQHALRTVVVAFFLQLCSFLAIQAALGTGTQIVEQNLPESRQRNASGDNVDREAISYSAVSRLSQRERVIAGLTGLPDEQVQKMKRAVEVSEVYGVRKTVFFHPTRHQLPFVYQRDLVLRSERDAIGWRFSHDAMQFIGHTDDLQYAGRLGPNGRAGVAQDESTAGRFPTVPLLFQGQLLSGNSLYRFSDNPGRFDLVLSLPGDEVFQSSLVRTGNLYALLSDRALYLLDPASVDNALYPCKPSARLEFTDDYNNLSEVNVVELRNEFLLSFLYGKDERTRAYQASQASYLVDQSFTVTELNHHTIKRGSSKSFAYAPGLIAPVADWLVDTFPIHPRRDRYLSGAAKRSAWPWEALAWQAIFSTVYFATTFWLATRRNLASVEKWVWSLTNMATGIPGILSFLALSKTVFTPELSKQTGGRSD
ncbi:MAG: hypothetical protein AB8B50_17730 [Pirellulaceae bacterium]